MIHTNSTGQPACYTSRVGAHVCAISRLGAPVQHSRMNALVQVVLPRRRPLHLTAICFASLALSACVSVPQSRSSDRVFELNCTPQALAALPAQHAHSHADRCTALAMHYQMAVARDAQQTWSLQGRAAITSGNQGGNARIDWAHTPNTDSVQLSAPVTRQSWRLDTDASSATLHGVPNGPLHHADAQTLLREATGWDIPVQLLRYWVRGLPSAASDLGVLRLRDDVRGEVTGFDEAGWRIDIGERDATGRPLRINAEQPASGHRVRLVIDQWDET